VAKSQDKIWEETKLDQGETNGVASNLSTSMITIPLEECTPLETIPGNLSFTYSRFDPYLEPKKCVFAPLPIYYSKVDITPDDPEYLEYIRHMSIKKSKGTRTIQDTIFLEAILSPTSTL